MNFGPRFGAEAGNPEQQKAYTDVQRSLDTIKSMLENFPMADNRSDAYTKILVEVRSALLLMQKSRDATKSSPDFTKSLDAVSEALSELVKPRSQNWAKLNPNSSALGDLIEKAKNAIFSNFESLSQPSLQAPYAITRQEPMAGKPEEYNIYSKDILQSIITKEIIGRSKYFTGSIPAVYYYSYASQFERSQVSMNEMEKARKTVAPKIIASLLMDFGAYGDMASAEAFAGKIAAGKATASEKQLLKDAITYFNVTSRAGSTSFEYFQKPQEEADPKSEYSRQIKGNKALAAQRLDGIQKGLEDILGFAGLSKAQIADYLSAKSPMHYYVMTYTNSPTSTPEKIMSITDLFSSMYSYLDGMDEKAKAVYLGGDTKQSTEISLRAVKYRSELNALLRSGIIARSEQNGDYVYTVTNPKGFNDWIKTARRDPKNTKMEIADHPLAVILSKERFASYEVATSMSFLIHTPNTAYKAIPGASTQVPYGLIREIQEKQTQFKPNPIDVTHNNAYVAVARIVDFEGKVVKDLDWNAIQSADGKLKFKAPEDVGEYFIEMKGIYTKDNVTKETEIVRVPLQVGVLVTINAPQFEVVENVKPGEVANVETKLEMAMVNGKQVVVSDKSRGVVFVRHNTTNFVNTTGLVVGTTDENGQVKVDGKLTIAANTLVYSVFVRLPEPKSGLPREIIHKEEGGKAQTIKVLENQDGTLRDAAHPDVMLGTYDKNKNYKFDFGENSPLRKDPRYTSFLYTFQTDAQGKIAYENAGGKTTSLDNGIEVYIDKPGTVVLHSTAVYDLENEKQPAKKR